MSATEKNADQTPEIVWNNLEAKALFAAHGAAGFDAFWDLESSGTIQLDARREHKARHGGAVCRSTRQVELDGKRFFLKKASGAVYRRVVYEFEANAVIPVFGLTPAPIAAHCLSPATQQAFLLFEALEGFDAVLDLIRGDAPAAAKERFERRKAETLRRFEGIVELTADRGYFYPDWRGKHLFIEREGERLALIDLERFLPKCSLPWYFRLPFYAELRKREELRVLRRAFEGAP